MLEKTYVVADRRNPLDSSKDFRIRSIIIQQHLQVSPGGVSSPGRDIVVIASTAFRRAVRCCNSAKQKGRGFLANLASSDRDGS